MVVWVPSPPSPSDPPRCDRPSRQISDFSPIYPDHALRFTAIRASERFRGRVALPALSGPLPRSAVTNASARNARHDAPRGPIRPRCQSTKRPASTSRRALTSACIPGSRHLWLAVVSTFLAITRGLRAPSGASTESAASASGLLRPGGPWRLQPSPTGRSHSASGRSLDRQDRACPERLQVGCAIHHPHL